MQIKAIELGDIFVHENGIKYQVDNIFCAYDEEESRWETSIGYKVIPKDPSFSTLRNVVKARDFVIAIQEQGAVGHNFVAQISGSTGPVTPVVDDSSISFTPGVTATASGNSSVAVGNGVAAPPVRSKIERDFINSARRYGFQPSDLGREVAIAYNGVPRKYTIVGANPRNHKYPILCRKLRNGTVYKFTADKVKSALA